MKSDKLKVPKAQKGDVAHALTKAGLSSLPYVGGAAAEIFQLIIQPPLERRRAEWMNTVAEKLKELEEGGLKLEKLKNNEEFISAVMQAFQIVLRTHQEAKRTALRNAILNIAKGQSPDETLNMIFLSLIDAYTEMHMRILKLFQAPNSSGNISMGGLNHILEDNIPELRGRRDLYDQLWKNLYDNGLVSTEQLHTMMSASGLTEKRTTQMGDSFLYLIEEHESK